MTTIAETETHTLRISRRRILELTGFGLGQIALGHLLGRDRLFADKTAAVPIYGDIHARKSHFPAQAKAVIQLIQNGGPSQMDLFDPKPQLKRMAGKPHPDGVEIHQPNNVNKLLPSPLKFRKQG
ncbi:MAG: DUF1501 domain-containing protein, partial [Planctomycetaceae bacterium]